MKNRKYLNIAFFCLKSALVGSSITFGLAGAQNSGDTEVRGCAKNGTCQTMQAGGLINCKCGTNSKILILKNTLGGRSMMNSNYSKNTAISHGLNRPNYSERIILRWNGKQTRVLYIKTNDSNLISRLKGGYKISRYENTNSGANVTFLFNK